MAQSLKQIKKTTQSIQNTRKTTRTMQLISVARLQKVLKLLGGITRYTQHLDSIAQTVTQENPHSIWNQRVSDAPNLMIVFGADRGLCGGYNMEVIKHAVSHTKEGNWKIISVGKKVAQVAKITQSELIGVYPAAGKVIHSSNLQPLLQEIESLKSTNAINQIWITYTHYQSSVQQEVVSQELFSQNNNTTNSSVEYTESRPTRFEPSLDIVYNAVMERYLSYYIYHAYIQASVSEQHARMTAMKQATDSAGEIIAALTLEYNKSRQQAITQEIAQIVGAAQSI